MLKQLSPWTWAQFISDGRVKVNPWCPKCSHMWCPLVSHHACDVPWCLTMPLMSLGVSPHQMSFAAPVQWVSEAWEAFTCSSPRTFWIKVWQTESLGIKIWDLNWALGSYTEKIEVSKTNISAKNPWLVEGRSADELPTASGVSFRLLSDEANVIQHECTQEIGKMVTFCSSGVFSGVCWWLWGCSINQPPWQWCQGGHRDGAVWVHQSIRTASILIPA